MELDTPLKNVLFWNCKGNDGSQTFCDALVQIINTHNIEIVGISECLDDKKAFVKRIRTNIKNFYCVGESCKLQPVGYIRLFSTLPRKTLKITKKKERFINARYQDKFDLCFVHLKSLVNASVAEKLVEDKLVYDDIYHDKRQKFVVGDFNDAPYSDTLVSSLLFNTYRDDELKFSIKRHKGDNIRINPCWEMMGDSSHIYGTLCNSVYMHNNIIKLVDQVIFDSQLKRYYYDGSFKILDTAGTLPLTNVKGIDTTYSDHLPIYFSLQGV